jgi:hypothetical protein
LFNKKRCIEVIFGGKNHIYIWPIVLNARWLKMCLTLYQVSAAQNFDQKYRHKKYKNHSWRLRSHRRNFLKNHSNTKHCVQIENFLYSAIFPRSEFVNSCFSHFQDFYLEILNGERKNFLHVRFWIPISFSRSSDFIDMTKRKP